MLKGERLLKVVQAMGGAHRSELVRHCGYVRVNADGQEHLHYSAFYEALLQATGVELPGHNGHRAHRKGSQGRDLTYSTHVHFNGNLMVGRAYTDQLHLKPGDQFRIELSEGQIRLVPMEPKPAADRSPSGRGKRR
ncbi:MAG: AbrB/MazE/SpoVT family DNA-binding domain-containing protein [Cyanobacteria bacterium REEB498]|nr:AbrB/MazE/SpoVT family DNA-binding domain-containing protein [Cyanobacteria bacterium REEB498]